MESYDVCLYPIVPAGNLSFYASRWCAEQEEQQKLPPSQPSATTGHIPKRY